MKKIIKLILLIMFVIIFAISFYKIIIYVLENQKNKSYNQELAQKAVLEGNDTESGLPISVDFSALKQENPDIIGWIYCENTPINYPILQTANNNYYLDKMPNGKYNSAGSIFMDYRNSADFSDDTTIIYGHNMKNNTMFGSITNYSKQSYYDEHRQMYLFTSEEHYTINLVAGYVVDNNSSVYNLDNSFEYKQEDSTFKSDVQVDENDKIIILSTCSYEYENARFILIGVCKI